MVDVVDVLDIRITLDRHGIVQTSGRVVMRVHLEHGLADQVPTHWRGATLDSFNGRDWLARRLRVPAHDWYREGRQFRRYGRPSGVRLEIELEPSASARLFAPLTSRRLMLHRGAQPRVVVPQPDGTFKYRRAATRSTLRYAVE